MHFIPTLTRYTFLLLLLFVTTASLANEGMWLPQLLQSLNEKDMKKAGMKISAGDIYSINKGSLKDAIVSLGGFCTAEVISEQGLLLTNHHCGFDAIQNHSTLQNNYIRDGFWARNNGEELSNPGLTATFIIRIDDVSATVLKNTKGLSEKERQAAIDLNIAELKKSVQKEAYQDVLIRPFFEGNKYFLFVTETYKDVRLVGAPPSSIGNFGKDTDNWMWPRHTGDFSLFRIYASKDNKPAEYSSDNVPYKPKRALTISLDGVGENDFTMVFGFPGRTSEYLHSAAVAQIMNVNDPAKVAVRGTALRIIKDYMMQDELVKIQYAAKYAGMENAYKKWQGEMMGLKQRNAVAKKKAYEAEFQKRVMANPEWAAKYGSLLKDLEAALGQYQRYSVARDYFFETTSKIELLSVAGQMNAAAMAFDKGGAEAYAQAKLKVLDFLHGFYSEYSRSVDKRLFEALMKMYTDSTKYAGNAPALLSWLSAHGNNFTELADSMYTGSVMDDSAAVYQLLMLPAEEAAKTIKQDAAVILLTDWQQSYNKMVAQPIAQIQERINTLQRTYMQAQMDVFKEKAFYPDANSTLRVTYGKVKSYQPRDAVQYGFYTYLDGVMEKYIPGDYEFDVPQKLIDLYERKDFGRYGVNGRQPVCFIATNHTTGGNSGSPALDAYGNLVGLNFDRVWEGTMSDINYDSNICRNIMVDVRYVAFIIDKFADAQNIVSELKFVHPKKNVQRVKKGKIAA